MAFVIEISKVKAAWSDFFFAITFHIDKLLLKGIDFRQVTSAESISF